MSNLSYKLKRLIKSPLESLAARYGPHQRPGAPQLWTLMYHRILPSTDPRYGAEEPGMIVEPDTFHQHIQWLKRLFTIVPLSEWVDRRQSGQAVPANACAITFDDGWIDNYQYAFPIIQQEQVPVTLFAVSHMIDTERQFWPNRLTELLQKTPGDKLSTLPWLQPYLPTTQDTTFSREQCAVIINQLKTQPDNIIHQWLSEAEHALCFTPSSTRTLMSWQQLREMTDSGLVDIGSHTCNHHRLREDLDYDLTKYEIEASQTHLQEKLNRPIDLFCYPNGDVSPAALELVKNTYKAAVTTNRGINSATDRNLHQLTRIGIHQDIADTKTKFQARLANWF